MKTKTQFYFLGLALLTGIVHAGPLGTEFTYQGRLDGPGAPVSGPHDFVFRLNVTSSGGVPAASVTNFNVAVSNGLFATSVDFGPGYFNGIAYWLEIAVRTNGGGAFTDLSPRQPLSPVPHASFAALAGTMLNGSVSAEKLASNAVTTPAIEDDAVTAAKIGASQVVKSLNGLRDDVTLLAGPNVILSTSNNSLTISGGTDASTNVWRLDGNSGATLANAFLGSADNQPLTLKVNSTVALRIDPAANGPNMVGGLAAIRPTVIASGVRGAVVAGGGAPAGPVTGVGGGDFHAVYDSDGTIGGGFGNKIGSDNADVNDAPFGTVGGGVFNSAANYASTVAGGDGNYAAGSRAAIGGGAANQAWSLDAVIAGGVVNIIMGNSPSAAIGGGQGNAIQTNSPSATISGGQNNSISPGGLGYVSAKGATIGGGEANTVFGFGQFPETALYNEYGTIGGGYSNTVHGSYGTVPGGYLNTASGEFSFAAGHRAKANHFGSFVWADLQNSDFASTADHQFNIRALGGVRFNTDTSLFFGNSGASKLWPDQGGAIELGNSTAAGVTPYLDFHYGFGSAQDYNVRIVNDGPDTLSIFRSGSATRMAQFSPAGLSVNGTFVSTSDRNAKENFRSVNGHEVLDKVVALPLSRWNYKDDKTSAHLGPMAQDFYAAFGVGPDDKHIATVDADGVALAAIQGLNEKVEVSGQRSEDRIQKLEAENAELKTRLERLERRVNGGAK